MKNEVGLWVLTIAFYISLEYNRTILRDKEESKMPGFGFDPFFGGFAFFGVMFGMISFLVIGVFVFVLVKGISTWSKNNQSPRLTVLATVIAKRTNVSHHHHAGNMHHHHTSTTYYVTFQVESGDRMELHLQGYEYGLLVEGDRGRLTFQGNRYLGFERT